MSELRRIRDAVARRELSAVEVVDHALRRIEALDDGLNAVVALRGDAARGEARALDAAVAAGSDPGPLAGVPVLVKDLEDVTGMVTTQGSVLLRDAAPADHDSTVVSRLRAAGAVVVGKSNLPEFATEGFTDNLLFGATCNPWATDWSPGGSSGGSAAAVASGMVPVATATDGGGSIRIPAASCGLVGLKPTNGLVGRWPAPDWIDYSTEGPFATSVDDLRLLMHLIAGPVAGDPTSWSLPSAEPAAPPRRAFAVDRFGPHGALPPEVRQRFESASRAFGEVLGVDVEPVRPEVLFDGADPDADWFTVCTAEHVARFGRAWVEAGLAAMHPAARGFMEWGLGIGIDDYLAARRRRFDYVRALDRLLGHDAVLLSPTVAATGWLADGRLAPDAAPGMLPPEVFNTALQNATGHPALSLPAGVCGNGVPFGLQVTAARYADAVLLDVAAAWEQARPWPRVAPGYVRFTDGLGLE